MKDCNYVDEDRQVRDQFVYGVFDEELKKRLQEKGNTLTRVEAITIGKAYMKVQTLKSKSAVQTELLQKRV